MQDQGDSDDWRQLDNLFGVSIFFFFFFEPLVPLEAVTVEIVT